MSKLASIERVLDIVPHPNADKLEIAKVLGYECIVAKDKYKIGDLVILIQPDTVLPDEPWTEIYKKFSKTRVRAIKLRNIFSYGIVESIDLLRDKQLTYDVKTYYSNDIDFPEGLDISEWLGITKYEAPLPNQLDIKGHIPFSIPVTDEERWQNLSIKDYFGQLVDITLKIDGQSCSFYYKDGEFGVLGRNYELKKECHNNYTRHLKTYDLENKIAAYCKKHNVNICLRGESYGKGIQSSKNNYHSTLDNNVAFYSVYLIDELRYAGKEDKHYFLNVCNELDLPTVPIIETVELSDKVIKFYDEEIEKVHGNTFEGIVIKGNNFSFKVINKYYDEKK